MTTRCNQCGHENNPEYRFCGMCGAPIPTVTTTREPERTRVSPPVGGPSFLGLGDDRSTDLDYLLEDEPSRGHGRLYLALLLLVVSAGLLAWHWQRDGYPWAGLAQAPAASKASTSSPSEPAPVAPAPVTAQATTATKTINPVPSPAPGETPPSTGAATGEGVQPPPAAVSSADSGATANPITVVKPAEPSPQTADNSDGDESSPQPSSAPADAASAPDAAGPSVPKETPAMPAATTQKAPAVRTSPAIPTPSPEDRLVDQGERYLYGRRVRADCALAQRNLMIGARQSNPKAQTLLGAMYATGHCVNRDLPTAYRWFAKALHGDPSNSRVQRDLEVLWKQMTPQERQLAMKSQ